MTTIVPVSDLVAELGRRLDKTFAPYSGRPGKETAQALLSWDRARKYFEEMIAAIGSLRGKRVLEVGCGSGLIVVLMRKAGIRAKGIDPSPAIAKKILRRTGISPACIKSGRGEAIPYKDNAFDAVASFLTLEHVSDVSKTLTEMVRVLRPGGFLYCVVPNYGSFWEPHYGIPWIPYLPRLAAKLWVRLWGKNPGLVDELQFVTISLLATNLRDKPVVVQNWGQNMFAKKLSRLDFSDLDAAGQAKRLLRQLCRLRLLRLTSCVLRLLAAHTPIVLVAQKKN